MATDRIVGLVSSVGTARDLLAGLDGYWMHVPLVIRMLWVQALPAGQHTFPEIDHKIFTTVILSHPLIQDLLSKECAQYWLYA